MVQTVHFNPKVESYIFCGNYFLIASFFIYLYFSFLLKSINCTLNYTCTHTKIHILTEIINRQNRKRSVQYDVKRKKNVFRFISSFIWGILSDCQYDSSVDREFRMPIKNMQKLQTQKEL